MTELAYINLQYASRAPRWVFDDGETDFQVMQAF